MRIERSASSARGEARAADPVGAGARLDPGAQLGDGDDGLLQPLGEPGAQGLGGEAGEEAHEHPGEEAQAHLLQAARVEGGDGGEPFGAPVRLVEHEPAAVGGAYEVHPVEAERVEGLVHPLRGALGLPHGLAVDAAVGVARGVECVDGAVAAEGGVLGYHIAEL